MARVGVTNMASYMRGVTASHKPKLLTTSMMVSVGNIPPMATKQYPLPLIAFKKILVST